jgi:hypothetical protein
MMSPCTDDDDVTALKHPYVFQTLHVYYSILFQDKVTVAQACFSIIFWPHQLIFLAKRHSYYNSELKMGIFYS